MISNRPYIMRAMYEWIVDNQWTPHVQVDANYPGVDVPRVHVQEDGVIVLNMAPTAVLGLSMTNDWFTFKARFGGVETTLGFPPEAVLAIFARENGQGMPFPAEPYPEASALKKGPRLAAVERKVASNKSDSASISTTSTTTKASTDASTEKPSKSAGKKKPSLSIVK